MSDWQGPEDLRPLLRDVTAIRRHPDNPRRGDVPAIAASLKAFGQLKPVIVKELEGVPTIYAGNHTYEALVSLGWSKIAVSEPAYLSDEEAQAYLYMDNRSADLATYDYPELTSILEERDAAGTLERTGFSKADLQGLQDEAKRIAGAALAEFEQGRGDGGGGAQGGSGGQRSAPAGPPLRQMLLTFRPPETFDDFARKIQTLRRELKTEDVSATIAAVIARAHATVWKDGA